MKINRNIVWAETFVNELARNGVKYACLSPGSRNTPLTIAFASNRKIKTYVHIDERSSGFFALGLAKATRSPVAIVCTSGTATAELYPAIVEAYQRRVPLIVCTADRPPELHGVGANQTINQYNMYKNHILEFFDAGVPRISFRSLFYLKKIAATAVYSSSVKSSGPVHINFPFRKPFEPDAITDEVDNGLFEKIIETEKVIVPAKKPFPQNKLNGDIEKIARLISTVEKGLIVVGPNDVDKTFTREIVLLSRQIGYPILADGASQLRFGPHNKSLIISNHDAIFRSKEFIDAHQPELILQFGRTITSKGLETFFDHSDATRFLINKYGDWFDPSRGAIKAIASEPAIFCSQILQNLKMQKMRPRSGKWIEDFMNAEKIANEIRKKTIEASSFPDEPRVIAEVLASLPSRSRIMLSNSMPIRDFDYFAANNDVEITVFDNRGASGIDGIISTALGIASDRRYPTVLITGDLAFYHDSNGLLAAKKYRIPLIIVLINNNGGGIFEILPISNHRKYFKDYFLTPHNLDFAKVVNTYDGLYTLVRSWSHLRKSLKSSFKKNTFSVLEIKTNPKQSLRVRRRYWQLVEKALDDQLIKST
ncbi:MAG: 2-succinyl-5-enolpyruvyl-6-hydroxy-3-cyclohexene-1-carboxylic-acid synthase [Candidatus Kryptoniota bacterium]